MDKLREVYKYSKDEIIEALERLRMPEWDVDFLLASLEQVRRTKEAKGLDKSSHDELGRR